MAVVVLPRRAEHVRPEVVPPLRSRIVFGVVERVGRGAKPDDRATAFDEIGDPVELVLGQLPESNVEHGEIRVLQRLETFDVVAGPTVQTAIHEHRRLESVLPLEQVGQRRHRPLGTVFALADHEHDVGCGRTRRRRDGRRSEGQGEHDHRSNLHFWLQSAEDGPARSARQSTKTHLRGCVTPSLGPDETIARDHRPSTRGPTAKIDQRLMWSTRRRTALVESSSTQEKKSPLVVGAGVQSQRPDSNR